MGRRQTPTTHPDEKAAGEEDLGELRATLVVRGKVALLVETLAGDGRGEEEILLGNRVRDGYLYSGAGGDGVDTVSAAGDLGGTGAQRHGEAPRGGANGRGTLRRGRQRRRRAESSRRRSIKKSFVHRN